MAKRAIAPIEFQRFGLSARAINGDVEVTRTMVCESPASACATQADKLLALTTLMFMDGFTGLNEELRDPLMLLVNDLVNSVANLAHLAVEASAENLHV
ncbi:hypothetical protein [Paraburkholderia ferrariae]|uniref:hypothetical protein n=1 Tax=Paraburkholderia ferrariae TaxID=386056 RepID=UPI000482A0C8|nr:hypothetical protein [Paraburkholderia ferrariae]